MSIAPVERREQWQPDAGRPCLIFLERSVSAARAPLLFLERISGARAPQPARFLQRGRPNPLGFWSAGAPTRARFGRGVYRLLGRLAALPIRGVRRVVC